MMVLEDPLDALEAMAPFATNAHLKDHVMIAPEHSPDGKLSVLGVPAGQGNLPIIEITRRLIDAGLKNITFEGVWGYRAAVKQSPVSSVQLGEGVFSFASPPFDPARCLLDLKTLAGDDPGRLVELENAAMEAGLRWLKEHFSDAGIQVNTPSG